MSPDTYRTYLGSFGANTFDDVLFALGKKHATASTLLDKVAPQKEVSLITCHRFFAITTIFRNSIRNMKRVLVWQ